MKTSLTARVSAAALICATVTAAASDRRTLSDQERPVLRVCADPNNLPFSNRHGEGFENRIAELLADQMDRALSYTWWPQRRGFIRHTLRRGDCDLVIGVPARFELVETTSPYYRSSYVFVTRSDAGQHPASLDDEALRRMRIGVHAIGDDYANIPPVEALARRGIHEQIHGYSIYGDYSLPDPPRTLIDAVAQGDVDVAIAWGPLAGYFAQRAEVKLVLTPLPARDEITRMPMQFSIAMGVRRGETSFKHEVERAVHARRHDIRAVLERYGLPLVDEPAATVAVHKPHTGDPQ